MVTILQNRASISQTLEGETQDINALRKHIPIAIVKEVVQARGRGWDASRISKEYNVDPSVIQKLDNRIAIPVDNKDGIVSSFLLMLSIGCMATKIMDYGR
jgi:hypothetical protein